MPLTGARVPAGGDRNLRLDRLARPQVPARGPGAARADQVDRPGGGARRRCGPGRERRPTTSWARWSANSAIELSILTLPLAAGVAILRYRLYDIDLVINRTLVYGVLTAALGGIYAAVSLGLGVAIGSGSTLPTAAATLAVALALQAAARDASRPRSTGASTARATRGCARSSASSRTCARGARRPRRPGASWPTRSAIPRLEVLLLAPGRARSTSTRPAAWSSEPAAPGRTRDAGAPRRRCSSPLVVHDAALGRAARTCSRASSPPPGWRSRSRRLRVEVRRRLAEVEDSRARIVTAGDEERRRLERDLHDGAQQRLVSIGLALRHVQARLPPGGERATEARRHRRPS